jgi:DNA-binding LacI/PurR family transcriptional regulator
MNNKMGVKMKDKINKLKIEIERPEPLYLIVKKKILDLIENGYLKENDRIPPEEEIARENNISRGTVRQALKELEYEGIIKRYPKRGTFITLTSKNKVQKICIVCKAPRERQMRDYFYGFELWGGIEEGIIENNLEVSFITSEKINGELENLSKFDGILYLIPMKEEIEILEKIKNKDIHLMLVGAKVDGFNYVAVDNKKGVEWAIKHLLEFGHRKIGGVFFPINYFDGYERYEYFLEILSENKIPIKKEWIKIMKDYWAEKWISEAKELTKEILQERDKPTAIFASSALVSIGVKECLDENKEKISLIGFDDFYLAKYFKPPLTVISQPVWELGRTGIKKLVEIIEKKEECQILIEPKLIIRKSVKQGGEGK